jgi:hypothetical protein
MADIFISYSREDRERVRPIVEGLQAQGWDVWWDPAIPMRGQNDEMERLLGSAGAVLVIWSAASRATEYVRAEAAAGLYKNKLIQVRIDASAPPRPFDQVDVADLGAWSGDSEDLVWRQVLAGVSLYAGAPGASRPQVMRAPSQGRVAGRIGYVEPKRKASAAPILAGVALVIAGGAVWLMDPLNWRGPRPQQASASQPPKLSPPALTLASAPLLSTAQLAAADAAWDRVDRTNIMALRKFLTEFTVGPQSESARSQLRVMDAQAWRDAVAIDTETAYENYLQTYPAEGVAPGAMHDTALERLVSLKIERAQALTEIQRGLASVGLYTGPTDGTPTPAVAKAVNAFAAKRKTAAPDIESAAPRDLRSFSDLLTNEQVSATLVTFAAAQADRLRIQQAEALRAAATTDAEALARTEIERAERAAWDAATRSNTAEAFRSYLGAQSGGPHAAEARQRLAALTRPPAFAASQLTPDIRQAVEAARSAETAAKQRAANARAIAAQADAAAARAREGAAGTQTLLAADGDRFETEVANGAPNGLGVKISGDGTSNGDRYRGELRNGHGSGLGVYEFSDNANNAAANALRYEGEHAGDATQGLGVTYWKNGDIFAGEETGARNAGRGVQTFANGQRYDGEVADGARNGLGVVWSKDGQVLYAGRWKNGELVEPMPTVDATAAATTNN